MYHRQRPRPPRAAKPRTRIDVVDGPNTAKLYRLTVDRVQHKAFTEVQFSYLAQQVLNVLQSLTGRRHRPGSAIE